MTEARSIDYQWPSCSRGMTRPPNLKSASLVGSVRKIEDYFSTRLGCDAILVPSGRAAISIALRFLSVGRSHIVCAPRFSSACVWDAIGRLANPSAQYSTSAAVLLAVHKWGQVEKISRPHAHGSIIEDSVDTLFQTRDTLFPLHGLCEILSLPKISRSFYGGMILTHDPKLSDFVRKQRRSGRELGRLQARLRLSELKAKPLLTSDSWSYRETSNTSLHEVGVSSALNALSSIDQNAETIQSRLLQVENRLGKKYATRTPGRLPPLLSYKIMKPLNPPQIMVRYRNLSGHLDRPNFQKSALLPLHLGVSERQFQKLFDQVTGFLEKGYL